LRSGCTHHHFLKTSLALGVRMTAVTALAAVRGSAASRPHVTSAAAVIALSVPIPISVSVSIYVPISLSIPVSLSFSVSLSIPVPLPVSIPVAIFLPFPIFLPVPILLSVPVAISVSFLAFLSLGFVSMLQSLAQQCHFHGVVEDGVELSLLAPLDLQHGILAHLGLAVAPRHRFRSRLGRRRKRNGRRLVGHSFSKQMLLTAGPTSGRHFIHPVQTTLPSPTTRIRTNEQHNHKARNQNPHTFQSITPPNPLILQLVVLPRFVSTQAKKKT
jgi:hypothetical protein